MRNISSVLFHYYLFISFLGSSVSLQATDLFPYNSITVDDVRKCSTLTLNSFLDDYGDYGDFPILESSTSQRRVGSLTFEGSTVIAAFRGAQGPLENFSCVRGGMGHIHEGFLNAYDNLKEGLVQDVKAYAERTGISLNEMRFFVTGHSKGTGVVPLVVKYFIQQEGISPTRISAITLSPLPVFSSPAAADYNKMCENTGQINFLADEDIVAREYVGFGTKLTRFLSGGGIHRGTPYQTVGKTISFQASNFPEFNQFVHSQPYLHLLSGAALVKLGLTPTQWGAHLPEAYAMLAPQVYEQKIK